MSLFGWEINTHRAIDRIAIEKSQNLKYFVSNSGIPTNKNHYKNEIFEGYDTTYLTYVINPTIGEGEKTGVSKWRQTFGAKSSYQQMIEAGTILEDALWQDEDVIAMGGDGRFNNHFYEAQNSGHKLTYGYGFHVNAVDWVTDVNVPTANPNLYNYPRAMRYFKLGFTESDPNVRRKYQAKMLVSVGHMLHMVNDMNVPAHVRDDAHPFGDPLEMWMRGGFDGNNEQIGFHVKGNRITGKIKTNTFFPYRNRSINKQSNVAGYMIAEADFTSENFVSKDTLYLDNDTYFPNRSTTSYGNYIDIGNDVKKRYIHNQYGTKIAIEIDSYLCNNIQKMYYPNQPHRRGRGMCGAPPTIKGDYSVFEDSGEVLIKRAMSNATGFLDYFFRGQIEAKIDGSNITIKNISDPNLVKDGHTATLRLGGSFRFKYTTRYDNTLRDFEFMRDWDRAISNIESIGESIFTVRTGFVPLINLAPGESIVVAIQRDTGILGKNIVVIYDGIIGDERGLAVCAAQTPSVMRN